MTQIFYKIEAGQFQKLMEHVKRVHDIVLSMSACKATALTMLALDYSRSALRLPDQFLPYHDLEPEAFKAFEDWCKEKGWEVNTTTYSEWLEEDVPRDLATIPEERDD
jgi:hypothetical protein